MKIVLLNAKLQSRNAADHLIEFLANKLLVFAPLLVCVLALFSSASSQGLPIATPASTGMNATKLEQIERLANADIADKKLPGAVVLIGHNGKIVYRKAFGNRALVPTVEPMTVDTIFDAASLTKPIATGTSVMRLVEQGKIRLNDTVGKYFPEIEDENAKRVTVLQLLTHVSGYRPDFDLGEKWTGREGMIAALKKEKLRNPPGTRFVYSDINFEILGEIIYKVSGKHLDDFAEDIFRSVGMQDSGYINLVPEQNLGLKLQRIAPTENIRGQNSYLGGAFEGDETTGNQILRGKVHDPTAYRMHGVAGHAGLFSTADDLAKYAQMLINGGTLNGKRILTAQTVKLMTTPNVISEDGSTRGLGWDINTSFSSNRGELLPLGSFGHTGFTGTSIWVDPVSQTFVIFLSNRVHPDGKGDVTSIRARVATIAASAIENPPIDKWKEAEAQYNASVSAQLPKFIETVRRSLTASQPAPRNVTVLNGIDILEKNNFKDLDGKKIGLVTNHTGRNLAGKATIDVLFEAKNVKLVSIFAPEHGIRGELDQENITDTKDDKTGLPVYSLYGETRRPRPEHLKDLDAIVYDIQDIGARFYTYTATLRNVMEEAAKLGKPIYVLDRPNPINGSTVEGPLADEDKLSFIAAHTIPVRYGLTIGELGQMMNAERKIGADLRVIKMEGWTRSMWFDETSQTWVNPSPNMRSLTEATLYPGIGLLETTNLSVGRGTDTPFEVIGAPWLDGRRLAQYLNDRKIAGVRFVPIRFKPNASVFKDEDLGGINIVIIDRKSLDSVRTGIEIACALRKLYTKEWNVERYGRLLVNADVLTALTRGDSPEQIERSWQTGIINFDRRRASYLLYK